MPTWTADALELWNDLVAEFGAQATYGAFTFPCILDPAKSGFSITITAYDRQADTVIDLLRTDAIANGLYDLAQQNPATKRPVVQVSGSSYTILKMVTDDPAQPSIRLSAVQLQ